LEDIEVTGADYIKPSALGNFRGVWEELPPESEREDDYGLGHRDNLQVRRGCVGPVCGGVHEEGWEAGGWEGGKMSTTWGTGTPCR
jgi:coatomer protein complex subunit gamma